VLDKPKNKRKTMKKHANERIKDVNSDCSEIDDIEEFEQYNW
jgi:hypothetical protein